MPLLRSIDFFGEIDRDDVYYQLEYARKYLGGQYKIFRKGFGIPGTEVNFTGIAYDDVWTKLEHFFNPTDLLRFDFGAKGYRIMIEQFIGLFIIYVIIQCFLVFFWEPLAKKKILFF